MGMLPGQVPGEPHEAGADEACRDALGNVGGIGSHNAVSIALGFAGLSVFQHAPRPSPAARLPCPAGSLRTSLTGPEGSAGRALSGFVAAACWRDTDKKTQNVYYYKCASGPDNSSPRSD